MPETRLSHYLMHHKLRNVRYRGILPYSVFIVARFSNDRLISYALKIHEGLFSCLPSEWHLNIKILLLYLCSMLLMYGCYVRAVRS